MEKSRCFTGRSLYLGLIVFAISCANYREAAILVEYVNQDIMGISELESIAFQHYTAVTGKNFTTNQAVLSSLKNDVIPTYQRFLYLLRNIDPQTAEIKQMHAVFIQGAEIIYSGFKTKMIGLQTQDENLVQLADEEIKKGVMETFKWRTQLNALYKKYDIVQKK